jgi:hypothetical protein
VRRADERERGERDEEQWLEAALRRRRVVEAPDQDDLFAAESRS